MISETERLHLTVSMQDSAQVSTLQSIGSALKSMLFGVYMQHQPSIKKNKVRSQLKTRLQLCFVPVQTLQLVSVVLEQCQSVSDYTDFSLLEDVLLSLRVDLWAEQMQRIPIAVMVSVGVLAISLLTFLTELLLHVFKPTHQFHLCLKLLTDFPAILVHRLLFLPLSLLYFRCVFDGIVSKKATEYGEVWLGVMSLVGLAGYGVLIALRICFIYESAWYQRLNRLLARLSPSFELKEATIYLLISLLLSFRKSAFSVLVVMFVMCLYLLLQLLYYQPYYNPLTQRVKAAQYACCLCACISAEAALITDTMTTAVCLVLFLSPCVSILTCYYQSQRYKTFHSQTNTDFWKFELDWRNRLVKNNKRNDEGRMLERLMEGEKRYREVKEYYLVVAHYYYYQRELPEIALLRLAMTKMCKGGLCIDFQVSNFSSSLCQVSRSEERDFISYENSFSQAKALDLQLCEFTCEVLIILKNKSTSNDHLQRQFSNLSSVIVQTKEKYRGLKMRFPNDPFLLETFGSFMESLFHDKAGADLITRGNFEKNRRKKTNINLIESYSSDDTGVMIISCDSEQFGKITYANEQLGAILRCKVYDIIGKDLADFLPSPFHINHNAHIHRFLSKGEAKEIYRKSLFLSSMGRFSIEVTFRFRPTAVQNVPYFIAAVRPKPTNREFVLFNDKLEITSHSMGFKGMVRMTNEVKVVGVGLEEVMPGVTERYKEGRESEPFVYRSGAGWQVGVMYSQVDLGSQTIRWMYVFINVRDIDDLFTNTSGEVMSRIRKELTASTPSQVSEDKYTDSSQTPKHTQILTLKPRTKDSSFLTSSILRETRDDGSSVTPTHTSFAASIQGIKLRRRALHAIKIYKLAYIVTILLVACCLAVSMVILYTSFHNVTGGSLVSDLGSSRLEVVKICHLARRLNLSLQGLEPGTSPSALIQSLSSEIEQLQQSIDKHFQAHTNPVSIWLYLQDKYLFRVEALISALTEFAEHAKFQANSPSPDVKNADFFYVYANGPFSLLKTLNMTIKEDIDDLKAASNDILTRVSTVSICLIAGVLSISMVFITKGLLEIYSSYGDLWSFIVKLPGIALQETIKVHQDRIECIHGEDYTSYEQSRVKQNPGLLHPPREYASVIAKTGVYVGVTVGFLLFLLFYQYEVIGEVMQTHMEYLNAKSMTSFLPTLALTLLKEVFVSRRTEKGYGQIVRENQAVASLEVEVREVLGTLAWVERKVLEDTEDMVGAGMDVTPILQDACPSLNTTSPLCEASALSKGQHQGMSTLHTAALDLLHRISEDTATWSDFTQLDDYVDLLTTLTTLTDAKIEEFSTVTSQQLINEILAYSSGYMVFSAGLYMFIYLPLISKLKEKCLSLWRVTSLIRRDYAAQVSRE